LRILPQFSPLVRLNLALLASTSLEFNSMLCGYKGARRGDRPGAIRHTFSYHAYSFPYTALENNLLYPQRASGTLEKLFHDRIRRARKWARRPRERNLSGDGARFVRIEGEVDLGSEVQSVERLGEGQRRFMLHQGSSVSLPLASDSVDFVVTDPPYYDNVQYGDLAAFFRVWLERMVPETEARAFWSYDMRHAAVDGANNGSDQYLAVLSGIFSECRRVMKPEGRLIFTYHHWKPRGWSSLTLALRRAGFVLLNRYVVHSENPVSVHINNLRSLTHDAILVLAARDSVPAPHWECPRQIDHSESRQFTLDCSELMGWALQAELDEKGVRRLWRDALSG
jgi:putative DNA methylase